jgi:hypothetical protein
MDLGRFLLLVGSVNVGSCTPNQRTFQIDEAIMDSFVLTTYGIDMIANLAVEFRG